MKRFVFTESGERDLQGVKDQLAERAGLRFARRVLKDVRTAANLLAKHPELGHLREDLTGCDVKFWLVHDYLIVYDPATKPIQILRILHGARNLEEILN